MVPILFFDTETTGLPKSWKAPTEDVENWPRLVQLAWILYSGEGVELARMNRIVRPSGFEIPIGASGVHGITTERALDEGVELLPVLKEFEDAALSAEQFGAHNIAYDRKIMGAELLRAGRTNIMKEKPLVCTMMGSTKFCAIPGLYGPKWPKLQELHRKLFNQDFDGAHDALADVEATARSFFELRRLGVM